ncbi:hypothetical protein K8352_02800 [Flavobacteriaceae bacterium F89]|uniref:Uncharacterized protein n=1 Tax=Cerina litoralis TaxID=2874477 RepID=A0AAE3ET37_9FLAO|nr:hypothetical protein [Cerina litoralis]MCG2459669.1 hypothetical protein [Cerina litoralis]
MKYQVNVEGGFTGLLREYSGEIGLGSSGVKDLLEAMESVSGERNQKLRDGLLYRITLKEGDDVYRADFYGPHLPKPIRDFIDRIKE